MFTPQSYKNRADYTILGVLFLSFYLEQPHFFSKSLYWLFGLVLPNHDAKILHLRNVLSVSATFCYLLARFGTFWYFLVLSVTFLLQLVV